MTSQDARGVLSLLLASYPDARVCKGTVVIFETMLRDLPVDAVRAAVAKLVVTTSEWPTIAGIRALCLTPGSDQAGARPGLHEQVEARGEPDAWDWTTAGELIAWHSARGEP